MESELEFNDVFCLHQYYNLTLSLQQFSAETYCNASYDGVTCWPPTKQGENSSLPCPYYNKTTLKAYRLCENGGRWSELSNYDECLHTFSVPPWPALPALEKALTYIYLIGCSLSLILLSVSLFIFCYFRPLQCTRLTIHKHLVVSFILRYVCMLSILHTMPIFDQAQVYPGSTTNKHLIWTTPILCRIVLTLLEYFIMCNIFWMFVEGLYLTSTLSVAVFSRKTNYLHFILIGWVSPIVAIVTWTVLMHLGASSSPCWEDYHNLPYVWVIRGPMISAVIINTIFLVAIIHILLTKMRASNTDEVVQLRKAAKAVCVLFPLLGVTNMLFLWEPSKAGRTSEIYQICNAVLQSSQGIALSVIYCFLNSEVRSILRRKLANRTSFTSASRRYREVHMTPNGSYVVAASSEVVLALSFKKCIKTLVDPIPSGTMSTKTNLDMEIDDGCYVNNADTDV